MEKKKYYGGSLFVNKNKKSEKSPDLSGDMELSTDTLNALIEMHKSNQPIMLRASAWLREGRSGKFYSVSLEEKKEYKSRDSVLGGDEIPF
jgi:hypothetical protein